MRPRARLPIRHAYLEVQRLEDMVAHALELLRLLEAARRAARTPAEWHLLNEQTRHAEALYNYLRDRRVAMRDESTDGPQESPSPSAGSTAEGLQKD
jgi:hypothetical protein